jgi:hypothetical protein
LSNTFSLSDAGGQQCGAAGLGFQRRALIRADRYGHAHEQSN